MPAVFKNKKSVKKKAKFLIILIFFSTANQSFLSWAQSSADDMKVEYDNRLLTIVAQNVDVKLLLAELSKATNISINYRVDLKKNVSMNRSGISIHEALKGLLKGINHLIIYSGSNSNKAKIEEVFVLNKAERRRISVKEKQLERRIKSYQRQIQSLKRRLSQVGENSNRGKRYMRSINRLERNIQSAERQMY